jgi:hypothetical protein
LRISFLNMQIQVFNINLIMKPVWLELPCQKQREI